MSRDLFSLTNRLYLLRAKMLRTVIIRLMAGDVHVLCRPTDQYADNPENRFDAGRRLATRLRTVTTQIKEVRP
jgi:hypothetical protein